MKKSTLILPLFMILSLISCKSGDSETSTEPTGLAMSKTVSWNTESSDTFIVDENVGTVKISGDLGGKNLYAANVNFSDDKISNIYFKYPGNISVSKSVAAFSESEALQNEDYSIAESESHAKFYDWKPDDSIFLPISERSLDHPVSELEKPVEQLTYEAGKTQKNVWVATSVDDDGNSVYTKKIATLWSFNDICNVWVVDEDEYLTTESKKTETADKFAEIFAKCYPLVRNVFGEEEDRILYKRTFSNSGSYSWSLKPMNYLSDTGTKINIVVYDIYGDKEKASVLGFFSNRDYYPNKEDYFTIHGSKLVVDTYSNEGKYFYLDSYAAIEKSGKILFTLVHEFQHMIHYAKKTLKDNSSDTNFNEMLSMLCEDMMQKFLKDNGYEVKDEESPKERLLSFMVAYYNGGIRGYNSAAPSIYYANAYAFGAWLCRQYGGAKLVKEMMDNDKTNNECIVEAVNSVNDTNYSFNDLFVQFIKACYGKDTKYTFNQDSETSYRYTAGEISYDYPMNAINLWDENSIYNLSRAQVSYNGEKITYQKYLSTSAVASSSGSSLLDSEYNFWGPAVFKSTMYSNLAPTYGMRLKRYGKFTSGTSATVIFKTVDGGTQDGMKVILYLK